MEYRPQEAAFGSDDAQGRLHHWPALKGEGTGHHATGVEALLGQAAKAEHSYPPKRKVFDPDLYQGEITAACRALDLVGEVNTSVGSVVIDIEALGQTNPQEASALVLFIAKKLGFPAHEAQTPGEAQEDGPALQLVLGRFAAHGGPEQQNLALTLNEAGGPSNLLGANQSQILGRA